MQKTIRKLPHLRPGRDLDMVLQMHRQGRRAHLDLRLGDPSLGLLSWAVPKAQLPKKPGEALLAVRQPLHSWSYGTFKGPLKNKGEVTSNVRRHVKVRYWSPEEIRFTIGEGEGAPEFKLIKGKNRLGQGWTLVNISGKDKGRAALQAIVDALK